MPDTTLTPIAEGDTPALLDLWIAAWSAAMPAIDFAARRDWMEARFAELRQQGSAGWVARREGDDAPLGFVLVNPQTHYLDQIAVRPDQRGAGVALSLLEAARRLSPRQLDLHVNLDNPRAIRFYEREGFVKQGEGVNPRSGLPIAFYRWTAG